jgi:hypothetical protein
VEDTEVPFGDGAKHYRLEDRIACDLDAWLRPGGSTAAQLQFSEREEVGVRIEDLSPSGMRVRSRLFVPVGAEVVVRVKPAGCPEILLSCCIRRAQMVERTPGYSLGMAISDAGTGVAALLARMGAPAVGGS